MDLNISKPDKLVIGFKEREEFKNYNDKSPAKTYKLAYIIYYDEKNVLRKEQSWNSWRDKKIDILEIENNPISGFVLSEVKSRSYDWFGTGRSVWRIIHPLGFHFEITSNNLQSIISDCDIIKGEIMSECVFAWSGANMSLIPIQSELYKQSIENLNRKKKELIKPKDVKIGNTVLLQDGNKVIYLGKYNYVVSTNCWEEKDYEKNTKNSWYGSKYPILKSDYLFSLKCEKLKYPVFLYQIENNSITKVSNMKIVEIIDHSTLSEVEVLEKMKQKIFFYTDLFFLNEKINLGDCIKFENYTHNLTFNSYNIPTSFKDEGERIILKGEKGYHFRNNENLQTKEALRFEINYKNVKFTNRNYE